MRRRVARPSAWHTSCGQAAVLLLAFVVPLRNQLLVIFLRYGRGRSMKWDGLIANRPLVSEWGHLSLSVLERSLGERCLSTLLYGEEGERTGDESLPQVVYWSAVGHYISMLVKCAAYPSAYLHGNNYLLRLTMFLLFNQLSWCQKKEMKRTIKGSEVSSSVSWASTSFILFQIGFGWVEITFSSGWHGEVNSFQAEHREILFQEITCVHRELHAAY